MPLLNWVDWTVLSVTLVTIVAYGTYQTRGSKNVQDYLKGGSSSRWWTIGLSVMATQASAITFLSTPGQAFNDGMGFVQFYFGLPIATVVICLVFITLYHRLKVYTAYEFFRKSFRFKNQNPSSYALFNTTRFSRRNYHFCACHYTFCCFRLELINPKYYYRHFSYYLYRFWWHARRKCDPKTSNGGYFYRYVGGIFLLL